MIIIVAASGNFQMPHPVQRGFMPPNHPEGGIIIFHCPYIHHHFAEKETKV